MATSFFGERKSKSKLPYVPLKGERTPTVLVVGSARSGTTWLAQTINYRNVFRFVFEPLYWKKVHLWRKKPPPLYLRSNESNEDFEKIMKAILLGKIKDTWTDCLNRKRFYHRVLVKCVYANLLLKWISFKFPSTKIVLILRHPCAVALSQLKHKDWRTNYTEGLLERYFGDPALMQDFLAPFASLRSSCQDDFDLFILHWCIENSFPIKEAKKGKIRTVFYERLFIDPDREFKKLFSWLDLKFDEELFKFIKCPSKTNFFQDPSSFLDANFIHAWKNEVPDGKIKRAARTLQEFQLDRVYGADSMPLIRD